MRCPSRCGSWTSTRTTPEVGVFALAGRRVSARVGREVMAYAGREAVRSGASVGRSAPWADCPAVLGRADLPPNSLRSLRSLRSDTGGKHEDEARCARGLRTLRSSATHRRTRAHRLPPRVCTGLRQGGAGSAGPRAPTGNGSARQGPRRLGRRLGAPVGRRGAQAWSPARGCAHPPQTRRRCLSGAPAGRAASSAARTPDRAPQGSRPKGPAAPPKRPGACRAGARTRPAHPDTAVRKLNSHRP